jgi:hypothetical protein
VFELLVLKWLPLLLFFVVLLLVVLNRLNYSVISGMNADIVDVDADV